MKSPDWEADFRRADRIYRFTASGRARLFVQRDGIWAELWKRHFLPVAGARSFTVEEYASGHLEPLRSHGTAFLRFDYRSVLTHGGLRDWCRKHAHTPLPNQAFLFSPRVWKQYSGEPLNFPAIPYIPEIDDGEEIVRRIAELEALRARYEAERARVQRLRDQAISDATANGHSLRRIGTVAALSFGRVRQIRDKTLPPQQ